MVRFWRMDQFATVSPFLQAILGGQCVETKEDLGEPLTHKIRNYISVVGVQRGLAKCDKVKEYIPLCNENNGLFCDSDYNKDINDVKSGYEATERIVAIESTADDLLAATTSCEANAATFRGVNELYTLHNLDHREATWFLGEMIYNVSQELPLMDLEKISEIAGKNARIISDRDLGIVQ
uniref:PMEI domain-containing protein n=1 Tax=Bursaphelenchus xylophilus TaxID=6326 RepID=A0A1I7SE00_BURXY